MMTAHNEARVRRTTVVARAQGVYYFVTGVWPFLNRTTFEWITGPKIDYWVVGSFGVVLAVIGGVLLLAARAERITREIAVLGAGSALAVASCDLLAGVQPRNTGAYFADAVVEVGLVGWWLWAWRGRK
ncbi:MAG TPA: hypothetical protein VK178_03970 [Opitutaceae bacterium]|nr:hypothetical protein [Opitutaceae bacterium]